MMTFVETKLRDWRLAHASNQEVLAHDLCNHVYRVVFSNDLFLTIWDEPILLGLEKLLDSNPPNEELYGEEIRALRDRIKKVRSINDLFYRILEPNVEVDEVIGALSNFVDLSASVKEQLRSDKSLSDIRKELIAPSEKIDKFLRHIISDLHVDAYQSLPDIDSCVSAIQEREGIGVANVLLVHTASNQGILLPINAKVQKGSGRVMTLTPAAQTFSQAVDRARLALVDNGLIAGTQDVVLSAELTEAEYSGGSIALGAAIAICSSARGFRLDTYTSFTGDINLKASEWVVQRVEGIEAKLRAAQESGCRRVFLPKDNEADIPHDVDNRLTIITVNSISDVLARLLLHSGPLAEETLQERKINLLLAECNDRGWRLSDPQPIQDGLQFLLSPPTPPDMKVNIYKTGTHSPKTAAHSKFQPLVDTLNSLDAQKIPLSSVQQVFNIKDVDLRKQIQEAIDSLHPAEKKAEQYCEYSFRLEDGPEKLAIKQYTSGKLQLQGYAGNLYKQVLEIIIPRYNLRYPNAVMRIEDYLKIPGNAAETTSSDSNVDIPVHKESPEFPYVGTDESGKGDYFGPLVIAAVWLDEQTQKKLETMGVRDSKMLSDQKCRELASTIRTLCRDKYQEVEISPERYNTLYEEFQREGKNLNHLLAWGHARALESILSRYGCQYAVADQFGDEQYIRSKLMEKGKTIRLLQTPKAERYVAVAAASILARDRFLTRLRELGQTVATLLPKGASPAVVEAARNVIEKAGPSALRKIAKTHFKTTAAVLGKE